MNRPLYALIGMALAQIAIAQTVFAQMAFAASDADREFENLAAQFVDEFPALSPTSATQLGDHRFDSQLDAVSKGAVDAQIDFYQRFFDALAELDWSQLSRANQIDAEILGNQIDSGLFSLRELEEWAWNPLIYTGVSGGSIYSLLSRDFAPVEERLVSVAARLEAMPRFLAEVREILDPERVPKVHAETAIAQNQGLKAIMDNMIVPRLGELPDADKNRLERAMNTARKATDQHQKWLEEELLPNASGNFRIGANLFDKKLGFALHTQLSRRDIRDRAETEYQRVREAMYEVARTVYSEQYPYTKFPRDADPAFKQSVIRAALEVAYQQLPGRNEIVDVARQQLEQTTAFVREKDLVEVPDDPIEIIIMPEFQRGIALAYCDPPGPLDKGLSTFYAVAPLPESWTDEQVRSFLREYNLLSIQDLTIHEAMPGHYLQLALSNRYPSVLRSMLWSGPFVEGWAVYAERIMIDAGYLDNDPLMRLINLKWYLRAVANAIIDQRIHVEGMSRDEAMELMIEGAFQEEREAAGKWTRAQLTSAQLSTYFVGYQEHADLRRDIEKAQGRKFSQRKFHDELLSYGSPPVQFVRAIMTDQPIPRTR